jgi:tartrate dehydratase beta subunit/fumarate hydratase class I family protein
MSKIHIIYIKGKICTVRDKEKQSKISHSQKKNT